MLNLKGLGERSQLYRQINVFRLPASRSVQ
jgi:hypothetical protein